MGRLIDEDNVISSICSFCDRWDCNYDCQKVQEIRKIPTVQPEQKTGYWIGIDDKPCDVYECDQCGTTYDTVDNTWDLPYFCPNCGSKMVEK